jgi:CubicO group peptidase (beta-lactamase class C family)
LPRSNRAGEASVLEVKKDVPNGHIEGVCDPRFVAVAGEFESSFHERDEVGASVCVMLDGETVVDLWGGLADATTQRAWQRDTVSIVFSCTKGATAICAHLLASRGELDLEAPVRHYWPEFARNGKEHATVRMVLDHSVGLPALRTRVRPGGCNDWGYMVKLLELEDEEPFWKPGIRNGYHMINFGWTVGELVRRVSGRSLGRFFREEVAAPLGLDFWIGLPEEIEPRVAPVIPWAPEPGAEAGEFVTRLVNDPDSIQALSLFNSGGFDPNDRACHAAEIGGAGGIANARSLAGMAQARRHRRARAHGRGGGRHQRGRDPADPDPLHARLHEVDRQPQPGPRRSRQRDPGRERLRPRRRRRQHRLRRPERTPELRLLHEPHGQGHPAERAWPVARRRQLSRARLPLEPERGLGAVTKRGSG